MGSRVPLRACLVALVPWLASTTQPHACGEACGAAFASRFHSDSCVLNGTRFSWDVQPHFHVSDACFGENDPSGLFYVDGVFHAMWQSHTQYVHSPPYANGDVGISLGHAVSADLVTWRQVSNALWPDAWFAAVSVYDGSVTLVDGAPQLVVAGLTLNSTTPFCFGFARPTDPTDPALEDWAWAGHVCGDGTLAPGDSPSTAWRASSGEWRFVDGFGHVYVSDDFEAWAPANGSFAAGICQDFYPVPGAPPNASLYVDAGATSYAIVRYAEGGPGDAGTKAPAPGGTVASLASVGGAPRHDFGGFYAPKSFDAGGRRLAVGWLRPEGVLGRAFDGERDHVVDGLRFKGNTQSLVREVKYEPRLGMLTYLPVAEMAGLRAGLLANASTVVVDGVEALDVPRLLANQSEIRVSFAVPAAPARLAVRVMTDDGGAGTDFYVAFEPSAEAAWTVEAGSADARRSANQTARLPLLATDATIDVLLYVDHTVVEAFFQGGRVAVATQLPLEALLPTGGNGRQGVALLAAPAATATVAVWRLASIWDDVATHGRA